MLHKKLRLFSKTVYYIWINFVTALADFFHLSEVEICLKQVEEKKSASALRQKTLIIKMHSLQTRQYITQSGFSSQLIRK